MSSSRWNTGHELTLFDVPVLRALTRYSVRFPVISSAGALEVASQPGPWWELQFNGAMFGQHCTGSIASTYIANYLNGIAMDGSSTGRFWLNHVFPPHIERGGIGEVEFYWALQSTGVYRMRADFAYHMVNSTIDTPTVDSGTAWEGENNLDSSAQADTVFYRRLQLSTAFAGLPSTALLRRLDVMTMYIARKGANAADTATGVAIPLCGAIRYHGSTNQV